MATIKATWDFKTLDSPQQNMPPATLDSTPQEMPTAALDSSPQNTSVVALDSAAQNMSAATLGSTAHDMPATAPTALESPSQDMSAAAATPIAEEANNLKHRRSIVIEDSDDDDYLDAMPLSKRVMLSSGKAARAPSPSPLADEAATAAAIKPAGKKRWQLPSSSPPNDSAAHTEGNEEEDFTASTSSISAAATAPAPAAGADLSHLFDSGKSDQYLLNREYEELKGVTLLQLHKSMTTKDFQEHFSGARTKGPSTLRHHFRTAMEQVAEDNSLDLDVVKVAYNKVTNGTKARKSKASVASKEKPEKVATKGTAKRKRAESAPLVEEESNPAVEQSVDAPASNEELEAGSKEDNSANAENATDETERPAKRQRTQSKSKGKGKGKEPAVSRKVFHGVDAHGEDVSLSMPSNEPDLSLLDVPNPAYGTLVSLLDPKPKTRFPDLVDFFHLATQYTPAEIAATANTVTGHQIKYKWRGQTRRRPMEVRDVKKATEHVLATLADNRQITQKQMIQQFEEAKKATGLKDREKKKALQEVKDMGPPDGLNPVSLAQEKEFLKKPNPTKGTKLDG